MIYVCDNCNFLFNRSFEPEQCPDCGSDAVRPANEVEQEEFAARLSGSIKDRLSDSFPDLVEINIEQVDCFIFKLPVTAVQIDSNMIMEIVVEHGISPANQNMVAANVWARPVGGVLSGFLLPIQVKFIPNESLLERAERITASLNESSLFLEQLYKFVTMVTNSGK